MIICSQLGRKTATAFMRAKVAVKSALTLNFPFG